MYILLSFTQLSEWYEALCYYDIEADIFFIRRDMELVCSYY